MPADQAPSVAEVVWQALTDAAERAAEAEVADSVDVAQAARELGLSAQLEADLGLTSLQVLTAAGAIGEQLFSKPQDAVPITDVRCVGDLCRIFEDALQTGGAASADQPDATPGRDVELEASLARASERRRRRGLGR